MATGALRAEHRCAVFVTVGPTWSFESRRGPISVEDELTNGTLRELLPEVPISPHRIKAMVPRNKLHRPEIGALIEHLKAKSAVPP